MKRRMLVVDDDPAILEVLEMRLSAMGFDVTATGDPARAVEAVDAGPFDVALLDLRMDPMDGITLMETIHGRQPRLPVLIMTAHGTIETAVEAVQRGAFDYLTKPFVRDELRAKIFRALASRRWARDRERLLAVGETLASSGLMAHILDAVAQAAVETTEAERCVVFQLADGRLVARAHAGSPSPSSRDLETAAAAAMDKGAPTTVIVEDSRMIVAAPLVVERGPAGALVIETATRVELTEDDLDVLALFSSQASVAIRNTHELERLRSGALAALGRMATQVAHELKNPLAGLRLYARHLEQRLAGRDDAEGADLAGRITSTVDHLASVVSDITAFGRSRELRRTRTALGPLLDECVSLARAGAEDRIEVVRAYDPLCPEAMVDPREIRKVFLNLVVNGLDALPGHGRLTISTRYAVETDHVTVTVEDTGVGMNDETLSRIFDLFFTTKPKGTGLGMAIVRSVVDAHGGTLEISSTPGRGTRVVVRLPVRPVDESSGRGERV
jgi:two-component system, OmpR family, phosphate regulon sensor histidine kinase PhoR